MVKGFIRPRFWNKQKSGRKSLYPVSIRRSFHGINSMKRRKVLRFDSYSESWLDFIMQCRRGNDHSHFEIVMGGVANDKVFNTIELFFQGLIEKKEAIKRLRYEKPNYQVVFRSQAVLERYLQYEGCEYYEG